MGTEIERKFLVKDASWRAEAFGVLYRQGYLSSAKERTVRIRVAGDEAWVTFKGPSLGIERREFEYKIPLADAEQMLELCEQPLIVKQRYKVLHGWLLWEIDVFEGENRGLVVAEVELAHADQPIDLPSWVGAEVSHDPRYSNANLVKNPFSKW